MESSEWVGHFRVSGSWAWLLMTPISTLGRVGRKMIMNSMSVGATESTNQLTSEINQPAIQSTKQLTNQLTNQPNKQVTYSPTSKPTNQNTEQPNETNKKKMRWRHDGRFSHHISPRESIQRLLLELSLSPSSSSEALTLKVFIWRVCGKESWWDEVHKDAALLRLFLSLCFWLCLCVFLSLLDWCTQQTVSCMPELWSILGPN